MAVYSNSYTQSQIMAMQKDAMNRVNQMQRLSRDKLNTSNGDNQGIKPGSPPPQQHEQRPIQHEHYHEENYGQHKEEKHQHNQEEQCEAIPEQCETEIVHRGLEGILDRIKLDPEMIMIGLLLILLVSEGADYMLIMALVYILL